MECKCNVCTGSVDFKELRCDYCSEPLNDCGCEICDFCDCLLEDCCCEYCDYCCENIHNCCCEICDRCWKIIDDDCECEAELAEG